MWPSLFTYVWYFTYESILRLVTLLTWFVSTESWISFVFPNSSTGIIRVISDCCYYFLIIYVLTQDLIRVFSSITMINGLIFKRERSLFFHININSDLPKIDELWYIAKLSEEAVKLQSNLFWQWWWCCMFPEKWFILQHGIIPFFCDRNYAQTFFTTFQAFYFE